MRVFFQTFSKILGFLTAISVFLIIVAILLTYLTPQTNNNFTFLSGDKNALKKIALINLAGPIISEPRNTYNLNFIGQNNYIYPSLINEHLNELDNENILGIVISINSPGGSVSATQEIYNILLQFKQKNQIPIYIHAKDILASGGYWLAMVGDKIFANYGTIIGSIGVKGPDWLYYNYPTALSSGLIGPSVESPNGIKLFSNSAGISKDIFNPFRKPTDSEISNLKIMVNDIYIDFVNLVSANRKIEPEILVKEIGAMIFNTKQAQQNYLIDGEKNLDQTLATLKKELKVDRLQIITNGKKLNSNFLNLNLLLNNNEETLLNNFCNNLIYEFSVVFKNSYINDC